MALSDYGVIATINGYKVKQCDRGFYTDPKLTIGTEVETDFDYLLYVGDKDFFVGFYKNIICYGINGKVLEAYHIFLYSDRKKSEYYNFNGVKIKIKQVEGLRYLCTFQYKHKNYKIYFGYGVDNKCMKWCFKHGWYGITKREINMLERYNMI